MGDPGRFGQVVRIGDALEIEEQKLDGGILRHGDRQLADGHVRIVAGRVRVTHADAALPQETVRDDAHRAALADDADRSVGRLHLDEHGREAGDRAGAEIGQALRIRPDDPHAAGTGSLGHAALLGLAVLGIGFAEAGGHQHRDLHAGVAAFVHRLDRGVARDRDDRELGRFREIAQARKGLAGPEPRRVWD